jgi:hypothetical protein
MEVRNYRLEQKVENPETKIRQGKGGETMYQDLDNVEQFIAGEHGGGLTQQEKDSVANVVKELKTFNEHELSMYMVEEVNGFTERHHDWLQLFVDTNLIIDRMPNKFSCRVMTLLRHSIRHLINKY